MITITDKTNKVIIGSDSEDFMPSIIFKSQLNRISHKKSENVMDDYIIIYFSNDRLIISYIYIEAQQRQELGINSNEDLMAYFDSITN